MQHKVETRQPAFGELADEHVRAINEPADVGLASVWQGPPLQRCEGRQVETESVVKQQNAGVCQRVPQANSRDYAWTRAGILLLFMLVSCGLGACRVVRGGEQREELAAQTAAPEQEGKDPWERGELPPSIMQGTPRDGGQVVVVMSSDPPSLNTIVDSDWWASRITDHRIYQSLVGNDPNDDPRYQIVPELAERWEIAPDQRTYTFYLRRGIRWHDGKPFTARDVVATFDKIQDEKTKAVHIRSYTKELKSHEALDEFTVRFSFNKPYFLVMDGVFASIPIQPAHVIAGLSGSRYNEAASNPLNRHPMGTGPFRFVEWESGQKIVIARNEAYWGRKPHLNRIVFRIVKDSAVSLQLAERQEVDVVGVTAEQWRKMDARIRKAYHRAKYYDNNYAWIGWNLKRPMFADARVRRALTMLIDRPGIINAMSYGLPRETTCHFYWASDSCDPSVKPLPYDPPAAAKMLEEAGWKDQDGDGIRELGDVEFRFRFMIPASSEGAARMATKLKEDFGRAGIDLQLQRVEWSAFVKQLRDKDFDACTLAWGDSSPRGDPTQIWHSDSINGGSNYISFRNARADAIMDEARVTLDESKRNVLYRELHRLLYAEQPYTWLYVRPRLSLIHRRIHGVRESLPGWQFEDWWVEP